VGRKITWHLGQERFRTWHWNKKVPIPNLMNLRFVIIKYVVFNLDGTGTEQKQYCSYTLFRDGTVTDHET